MSRYFHGPSCKCRQCDHNYRGGCSSQDSQDGGYARWEGQDVYWDAEAGGIINIFPGGMPPRDHRTHDHDHIKIRGASVTTLRGVTIITGGQVAYKRINGVELIK